MIPGRFDYYRPSSAQEAVALLAKLGDEARPLAGGHSLIPVMKTRLAAPEHLIDLGGIADIYLSLYRQRRAAWTFEADVRTHSEPW